MSLAPASRHTSEAGAQSNSVKQRALETVKEATPEILTEQAKNAKARTEAAEKKADHEIQERKARKTQVKEAAEMSEKAKQSKQHPKRGTFSAASGATLKVGDCIALQGLVTRTDLNGTYGTLVGWLETDGGRWAVKTDKGDTHHVKPINLRIRHMFPGAQLN